MLGMAAIVSEESAAGRSSEELSTGQQCQSGEGVVEWRSLDQTDDNMPSTSPPYWDTDDSDDDGGPKPSTLYGKYTWKIEKFSQINKRELRSNAFEVGGYKWYILIYPQGCDVCNHLSLFLCVANHDKLLPGWSHFAQFTIAVINKDPKKSKYSDTLHRFWKKEHDWGWKKFMELSKVSDGFVDADTLIIKTQVQVIREKSDRPFRCLDCQYRRELARVYLTNVEQICRRFVEERRGKLGKLIEDKARWSSFCAFWLGTDQNARRRMSREKMDTILKVVVKHFFIEKEVTSTLVMDSLYSGLKALEGQSKGNKGKGKVLEGEDTPAPIVQVEKDMFVLVDDVLLLLERAAMEPLPPKEEKGPQNRTKDGANGEDFNKESIERDERRLTELGRRTVEIFVLAHIFSNKIEVAYQEAVALKRQEELIREEEAAWQAESEQKAKRGAEKDKKSKKKQVKQKRNNRKGKDKVKDEKPVVPVQVRQLPVNLAAEGKNPAESQTMLEKDDALADASDVSDSVEHALDVLQLDSEDRDSSPVNWDTDTSEIHPPAGACGSDISSLSAVQNGGYRRGSAAMDDSSSTCSTDSAPSVVANGSYRSNAFANHKSRKSPIRGKNQLRMTYEGYSGANGPENRQSEPADVNRQKETSSSRKAAVSYESAAVITSLQDRTKWPELSAVRKDDEVVLLQRKPSNKDRVDIGSSKEKTPATPRLSKSPPRNTTVTPTVLPNSDLKSTPHADSVPPFRKISSNGLQPADKAVASSATQAAIASRTESAKTCVPKLADKLSGQQAAVLSRPSSAPLIPGTLPAVPVVSMVQSAAPAAPPLSRSISVAGRLGNDPSPTAHPYIPQSYRNAIMGNSLGGSSPGFTHSAQSATAVVNTSSAFSQQPGLVQAPLFLPQVRERVDPNCVGASISFTATTSEEVLSGQQWMGSPQSCASRSSVFESPSMRHDMPSFDSYRPMNGAPRELFPSELLAGTSGRPLHGALSDDSRERVDPNCVGASISFTATTSQDVLSGQQWMGSPQNCASRSSVFESASRRHDMPSFDSYRPMNGAPRDLFPSELLAGTSGRPLQGALSDDFPHLDIINDLLDDEQGIGRTASGSTISRGFRRGPTLFPRQFTHPTDINLSSEVGSLGTSCRFDRSRSLPEDGFQQEYCSSSSQYSSAREFTPHGNSLSYMNGQVDSLVPNQWQVLGPDLSLLGLRNSGLDGYPYSISDYLDLTGSVNGYTVFRPSNGH